MELAKNLPDLEIFDLKLEKTRLTHQSFIQLAQNCTRLSDCHLRFKGDETSLEEIASQPANLFQNLESVGFSFSVPPKVQQSPIKLVDQLKAVMSNVKSFEVTNVDKSLRDALLAGWGEGFSEWRL